MPTLVHAEAPPPVTGIHALQEPNGVRVMWDRINDPSIARYQIYFSRASILDSGGQFEDFEVTTSNTSEHLLRTLPPGSTIFISVIAENKDGQDSGGFIEEVELFLLPTGDINPYLKEEPADTEPDDTVNTDPVDPTPTVDDAPVVEEPVVEEVLDEPIPEGPLESNQVTTGIPSALRLLTTISASPQELVLAFSHNVTLPADVNVPLLFSIKDGNGNELLVEEYDVDGPLMTLYTSPQTEGVVYEVQISDLIQGQLGDVIFPLDPFTATALVMGKGNPVIVSTPPAVPIDTPAEVEVEVVVEQPVEETEPEPPVPAEPTPPVEPAAPTEPDVPPPPPGPIVSTYRLNEAPNEAQLLTLTATPHGNAYLVDVTWEPPLEHRGLDSYRLSQSQNEGRSYLVTQSFFRTVHTARIHAVPAGSFGVLLQGVTHDGHSTSGVFTSVDLPPITDGAPLAASVLDPQPMTMLQHTPPSAMATQRNLAATGIGGGALVSALGAALGYSIMRRRRRSQA